MPPVAHDTVAEEAVAPTILNFGREDMSHITPTLLDILVKKAACGECDNAVLNLIQLVHFNPAKPGNMNVYIAPGNTKTACVFVGGAWTVRDQRDTVFRLACDNASLLVEHAADSSPATITQHEAERIDAYYDTGFDDGADIFARTAALVRDQGHHVLVTHPHSISPKLHGR